MVKKATIALKVLLFAVFVMAMLILGILMFYDPEARAANYPLQIIQPQPDTGTTITNTNSRFAYAYPGIEYNVKVAVIGGAYPFTYQLITAPSGMIINSTTGVISWPNPTTSGACGTPTTGCPVATRVTDQEGTTYSVGWRMQVTTNRFLFVDAANGHHSACNITTPGTATGLIANPFKDVSDWYCGAVYTQKHDSTYANQFVYYRGGASGQTYATLAINSSAGNCMQFNSDPSGSSGFGNKPVVHMAYPGETVTMDVSAGCWGMDADSDNGYFDRLNFINMNQPGGSHWAIYDHNGRNFTIRRSTFTGLSSSAGSNNQSAIFFDEPDAGYVFNYKSLTENTFTNILSAYAVLIYAYQLGLIELNTFDTFSDPTGLGQTHVVGLKGAPRMWFVRGNTFKNISGNSLDTLYANGSTPYQNDSRDYEWSFNLVNNISGDGVGINADCNTSGGPIYVIRNTFINGHISLNCAVNGTGPFTFKDNVIQNADTTPSDHIMCSGLGIVGNPCPSTIVVHPVSPVAGFNVYATSGLVDSSGNLTGSAVQYLGTKGYQTGKVPSAPTGVHIQ